jgi:hypothetical protein
MTLIGVLFVLRGLGLGIPYISPSETALFVKATQPVINSVSSFFIELLLSES